MIQVTIHAPGAYAEVKLPCVPDVDKSGVATVVFSVGELIMCFVYVFC